LAQNPKGVHWIFLNSHRKSETLSEKMRSQRKAHSFHWFPSPENQKKIRNFSFGFKNWLWRCHKVHCSHAKRSHSAQDVSNMVTL
jgi:hypothetical protein